MASDGIWDVEKMYDSEDENIFVNKLKDRINYCQSKKKDIPICLNKEYILPKIENVRDNQTSLVVCVTPPSQLGLSQQETSQVPISSEAFPSLQSSFQSYKEPFVLVPASQYSSGSWGSFSFASAENSMSSSKRKSSSSRRSKSSRSSRGRKYFS